MNEAVIVSAVRTPVGKAPRGLATGPCARRLWRSLAIKAALERAPGLDPAEIDDVIMGLRLPRGRAGPQRGPLRRLLAGLPRACPA